MSAHDTTARGSGANRLQRWWREHSELDERVDALESQIDRANPSAAADALEDLAEVLSSHFDVEEDTYFPLVETLSEENQANLQQARLAHIEIRADLDELRETLAQDEIEAARRVLERMLERFRTHELMEIRMIAELQNLAESQEPPPSPPK